MAGVASNLLALSGANGPFDRVVYQSPAGYTTIVKWISIVADAGVAGSFAMGYELGSGFWVPNLLVDLQMNKPVQSELWWVVPSTKRLFARTTTGTAIYWAISGTQLLGIPPNAPQGLFVQQLPGGPPEDAGPLYRDAEDRT